jgi:uncharacterized protein involved in exopolysaccharide biosynthesis
MQDIDFDKTPNSEDGFDLKKVVGKLFSYWYLFLIGFIVFIFLGIFYLRYATPSYKINSQITIQESGSSNAGDQVLKSSSVDFSSLFDLSSNAYNELSILKSRLLMQKTVRALNLNITVFAKGRLKAVELFDDAPFTVRLVNKVDSIDERNYDIDITGDKIHLKNRKDDISKTFKFGDVVTLPQYALVFEKKDGREIDSYGYKLNVQSEDEKIDDLSQALNVDLTDKKSTTLALTFEYSNPKKGEAILQKLMDLYLQLNLQNKTQIADSTLKFIDQQLGKVDQELSKIEKEFTQFKQDNKIANVDEQGKDLIDNVSTYYNKLSDAQVQISIVNDVEKFISDPKNKRLIPSSFAVPDPVFADAIGKYNDLLIERDKMELSYKNTNPVIQSVDAQIENVRTGLIKSFESYKQSLNTTLKAVKSRNSDLQAQVSSVPQKDNRSRKE